MDDSQADPISRRISDALRAVVSDRDMLERATRDIREAIAFLNWKPPPESDFFDFAAKVNEVVHHFASDGLGREDYLKALLKQPTLFTFRAATLIRNIEDVTDHFITAGWTRQDAVRAAVRSPSLFYQKPTTVIGNIEAVVNYFAADGLTTSGYLRAARTHPQLFAHNSIHIIDNIESVVHHFAADGLTCGAYLRAATKHASLFVMKPETVIKNIEQVVQHFAADGLTCGAYLRAATKHASLFVMKPETVIKNIEQVVQHFESAQLTQERYLQAALKQPQLFVQKPETIIGHVNLLTGLCRKGVLAMPKTSDGIPVDIAVLQFLITTPQYLCLANDNFTLREIYARVSGAPPSIALLRKSRRAIEDELGRALGHADLKEPVPKRECDDSLGLHARNVLLRALIREGTIRGTLC